MRAPRGGVPRDPDGRAAERRALPRGRRRRSRRHSVGRRRCPGAVDSALSTGSGASPTTYRVPPRPATPTTWQRSWLGGKAVRISRRPFARRSHRVPPARVAATGSRGPRDSRRMPRRPGQRAGGLRLLAAAAQIANDNGWGSTWGLIPFTGAADIAAARDALGERAPEIEAEGAALTLEQAVELAIARPRHAQASLDGLGEPQPDRARGRRPPGRRQDEPGDRIGTHDLSRNREDARLARLDEARAWQPIRNRRGVREARFTRLS